MFNNLSLRETTILLSIIILYVIYVLQKCPFGKKILHIIIIERVSIVPSTLNSLLINYHHLINY